MDDGGTACQAGSGAKGAEPVRVRGVSLSVGNGPPLYNAENLLEKF